MLINFYEDPLNSTLQTVGQVHGWHDADNIKNFALALQKNALKWFETHLIGNLNQPWDDLKAEFLKIFGKTRFELDLAGENGKMLASEDPLSYVFHMLSYMQVINPGASELEKTNRLIDGLPWGLKSYFVRDTPKTVHEFTEHLKAFAVEHAYNQSALSQAAFRRR